MAEGPRLKACAIQQPFMAAIEDALLVAGGLGTRMLPTSASVPKEALPLVDVPALVHLAREAIAAGVKRLHIVTSPRKDLSNLLADHTWLSGKRPELDATLLAPFADVDVQIHVQQTPLGLGNAIQSALHAIDGPFLVLLGDNLLMDTHSSLTDFAPSQASARLASAFEQSGRPCAGLLPVQPEEVSNYGVVRLEGSNITEIVEKPLPENAPSNLVLCGRYVFTSDAAALLEHYDVETHGELQSIALQQHWMDNGGLHGVELEGYQWYDSGKPLPWLKAQVDHALRRQDMAQEFRSWLEQRLDE
jgi:UTP--glucose-1-phosphate uridylyltransferase